MRIPFRVGATTILLERACPEELLPAGEVPRGADGRLAVRGPTGCRYLADPRQSNYVMNG